MPRKVSKNFVTENGELTKNFASEKGDLHSDSPLSSSIQSTRAKKLEIKKREKMKKNCRETVDIDKIGKKANRTR